MSNALGAHQFPGPIHGHQLRLQQHCPPLASLQPDRVGSAVACWLRPGIEAGKQSFECAAAKPVTAAAMPTQRVPPIEMPWQGKTGEHNREMSWSELDLLDSDSGTGS